MNLPSGFGVLRGGSRILGCRTRVYLATAANTGRSQSISSRNHDHQPNMPKSICARGLGPLAGRVLAVRALRPHQKSTSRLLVSLRNLLVFD